MNDQPYSNREIDTFLLDLRQSLQRIETQLDNSEVQLGKMERRLFWWQGMGTAISLTLTFIVIPAVSWLFLQVYTLESTLDKRINSSITTSLTNYGLINK